MTDLTERERQIVAWLRAHGLAKRTNGDYGNTYDFIATAIERGEPWGEQS